MKRLQAILAATVLLMVPAAALAFNAQGGDNVTLAKGETKTGTFYAAGRQVTIDGDVDGDLICAGNSVSVNGAVHGDVICAGQTVTVNGPVDGSVRLAGQVVNVNGTVGRNGTIAGQSVNMGSGARVAGDLGLAAQTASVNGPVDKDVYGAMESLSLGASVGGVTARLTNLTMGPSASVKGDVDYTSEQTLNLDKDKVSGQIKHTAVTHTRADRANDAARAGLAFRLYWMVAAVLTGLVFVLLAPRAMSRVAKTMLERPGASIGWGLVVTLLAPVLVLLLLVTVIGIPLAIVTAAVWLLLIGTSGLFAGIAAGEWFLERAEWRRSSLLWAAGLGIPLSVVIFSIPFLGGLVAIVASWWGVGGVSLAARRLRG